MLSPPRPLAQQPSSAAPASPALAAHLDTPGPRLPMPSNRPLSRTCSAQQRPGFGGPASTRAVFFVGASVVDRPNPASPCCFSPSRICASRSTPALSSRRLVSAPAISLRTQTRTSHLQPPPISSYRAPTASAGLPDAWSGVTL
jgi:hypothetical protein